MPRFAPGQADLFAPAPEPTPEPPPPARPPLEELAELLAELRATERIPWPNLKVATAFEQHYLSLAYGAGPEGKRLAALIMDEAERLFWEDEQEALKRAAAAVPGDD
jgi:hypothetical protein